jgi:hypothetical protein
LTKGEKKKKKKKKKKKHHPSFCKNNPGPQGLNLALEKEASSHD